MPEIEVVFDDILHADVDAIVNPANTHMLHGGGLAAIIAHAGGKNLVQESRAKIPVKTGEAITTTAGELPFRKVIHTVGPIWEGTDADPYWRRNSSDEDPDELLRQAHVSALKEAFDHELRSVAFPAVSCGVFRFPVDRAAPIAVKAVEEHAGAFKVDRVLFCLLDDDHFSAFHKAIGSPGGCSECGLVGGHKLQCSQRPGGQVKISAKIPRRYT